jgi:hypothetical protein
MSTDREFNPQNLNQMQNILHYKYFLKTVKTLYSTNWIYYYTLKLHKKFFEHICSCWGVGKGVGRGVVLCFGTAIPSSGKLVRLHSSMHKLTHIALLDREIYTHIHTYKYTHTK